MQYRLQINMFTLFNILKINKYIFIRQTKIKSMEQFGEFESYIDINETFFFSFDNYFSLPTFQCPYFFTKWCDGSLSKQNTNFLHITVKCLKTWCTEVIENLNCKFVSDLYITSSIEYILAGPYEVLFPSIILQLVNCILFRNLYMCAKLFASYFIKENTSNYFYYFIL